MHVLRPFLQSQRRRAAQPRCQWCVCARAHVVQELCVGGVQMVCWSCRYVMLATKKKHVPADQSHVAVGWCGVSCAAPGRAQSRVSELRQKTVNSGLAVR